ncbi:unnamed protein product [Allacma fusca]|uniref:MARVEL domain-containing protein n=1 Tax=Allacma fusca TaxID=39272 RepID=A0A8J2LR80_9HEXA|nr:unnamed protein product [Allacma fusca]
MDHFSTLENKLKLGTVIVGIFSLGLHAGSFGEGSSSDEYALAIVILAFMFSVGVVIATVLNMLPQTVMWQKIEIGVNLVFTVLLAIGWLVFMINTAKWHLSSGQKATRSFALIFGGFNDAIYGFISYTIFRQTQTTLS